VYYAFDTRADALFLGCLLGLVATGGHLEGWKPRTKRIISGAALVAAAIMIWILINVGVGERSLPLAWESIGEVSAALIIIYFVVQPKGFGTRLVGVSFLVLVGNMSYMIYLTHFPIFVAISPSTVHWSMWVVQVVRFAILIPLVVASWYLMEQPLMRWRRRTLEPARAGERTSST
jgi:peptidoglycan/LPS O-acetylase OafA/YrhL